MSGIANRCTQWYVKQLMSFFSYTNLQPHSLIQINRSFLMQERSPYNSFKPISIFNRDFLTLHFYCQHSWCINSPSINLENRFILKITECFQPSEPQGIETTFWGELICKSSQIITRGAYMSKHALLLRLFMWPQPLHPSSSQSQE